MSTRTLLFTDCVDFVGSACKPFAGMKKYVSTGAVDVDHINDSDTEIVDYDGKPSRANLEVMAGDVLFAKMQGTKKTLLINPVLANHIYSTGFCAVRAKEGILTERCLYHLLTSEMFLSQKDKNCSGATQKAITNAGLGKIVIHVPSVEEQNNIADQLDAVIGIITKRQQELSALDDLIKARFVEMFGDPVDNPKGWKRMKLQEIVSDDCTISYGIVQTGDDQEEGIPVFRPVDIVNHIPTRSELKRTTEEISNKYKRTILKGRELLITVRANIADTCIVGEEFVGCNVGRGIVPLRTKEDEMILEFLKYQIDSKHLNDNIKALAKGITLIQLNMEDLREISLIVPPIEQQKIYVEFAEQVDKSKVVVQKALNKSLVLFDSLMQQYFR